MFPDDPDIHVAPFSLDFCLPMAMIQEVIVVHVHCTIDKLIYWELPDKLSQNWNNRNQIVGHLTTVILSLQFLQLEPDRNLSIIND